MMAARRSEVEIVIKPGVAPHTRQRIAVTVLFAPDVPTAAVMLLDYFLPKEPET
jgi:hypothetical protein